MVNQKYYNDIKTFPSQFSEGLILAKNIKIQGNFNKVVVCGMGGSSLYVDIINDFLASENEKILPIFPVRHYTLPSFSDKNTLCILASYSGDTEEPLVCFEEAREKGFTCVVITAGGTLFEKAKQYNMPFFVIPATGLQPRLSTGYFIAGLMKILSNTGIIKEYDQQILKTAQQLKENLEEEKAKQFAFQIKNKVPIIYATDNNFSLARVAKIKFNENAKTQSFYNYFPEVNHNEMVGFSKLVMNPFFLIFQSQFTHERNKKRIGVFTDLMKEKDIPVEVISMKGNSVFEEIMNAYYFIDHVTYYLAEEYGVDPERVDMVEEFKEKIKD